MNKRKIDPICGMKGHIKAHGHFFCSVNCIKKFEKQNKIKKNKYNPCCSPKSKNKWYKDKLLIVTILAILLFIIGYIFHRPLFDALLDFLKLIWWAILLGLLFGGVIDHFIPKEYIQKFFATHKSRNIFYAVVFGFLMSACSHGILAIAIELYKKGANTSSVIAFLLASPWANLPITILLFGFFGVNAIYLIISAILIAIITGFIFQILEKKNLVECDKCDIRGNSKVDMSKFSVIKDLKKRLSKYQFSLNRLKQDTKGVIKGSWALSRMVLWWILIGMIFASLARTFVPAHIFHQYLGPTALGLFVTLIFATIIEVCSEGSAPLAFEIYNQTGAFGNSFVFLQAGVVSDFTEVGLIWSNIGKRAALFLPLITIPQVVLLGYLFNIFL